MVGELSEVQIEELLRSELIGRIGCHAGGRTYVVPITYAYDGRYVYAHSGEGRKVRMMRANSAVCFEVDRIDDVRTWRSVIAEGVYEELRGAAAERALQLLLERVSPLRSSETSRPIALGHGGAAGAIPVVFRIALDEKTGRYERD